jgi:CheY-like chemotaxis protein
MEALEWIAAGQYFDVIVCDLMMPGMTGMQVHEHLSRTAPEQAERMIFLTGGAFTPQMKAFVRRPDRVYLQKPFEPAALRSLVSQRIGKNGAD